MVKQNVRTSHICLVSLRTAAHDVWTRPQASHLRSSHPAVYSQGTATVKHLETLRGGVRHGSPCDVLHRISNSKCRVGTRETWTRRGNSGKCEGGVWFAEERSRGDPLGRGFPHVLPTFFEASLFLRHGHIASCRSQTRDWVRRRYGLFTEMMDPEHCLSPSVVVGEYLGMSRALIASSGDPARRARLDPP